MHHGAYSVDYRDLLVPEGIILIDTHDVVTG